MSLLLTFTTIVLGILTSIVTSVLTELITSKFFKKRDKEKLFIIKLIVCFILISVLAMAVNLLSPQSQTKEFANIKNILFTSTGHLVDIKKKLIENRNQINILLNQNLPKSTNSQYRSTNIMNEIDIQGNINFLDQNLNRQ